MKKIARQLTYSVRAPPTTGPIESASAETPAQVPIALPRSSAGNAWVTIESVAGIISAAPMPCTARRDDQHRRVERRSPAVAEVRAKMMTPVRNIGRRPKMSPSRPPVAIRTAKVSV